MQEGKKIGIRFKGKLVKMIKDVNGRFDDYSISPKIRQIFLHSGYKLVQSDLLWFFFCSYKDELWFFLMDKDYCRMQKIDIIILVVKEKLFNIILLITKFWKKMQKINIENCHKNKKK